MERITLGKMQNPVRGFLHGSAAVAALIGMIALVVRSWGHPTVIAGSVVFGLALVIMYTVSSLYHSIPWRTQRKARLQRVDHSMIYLVVAGTFTPILIGALEGATRWVGLGVIWVLAATGITLKATLPRVATWLSVSLQLAMGWTALIWMPQIHDRLGTGAVALIALGGACYTIGAVIFVTKKPVLFRRIFSYHELFHSLVVTASVLHFAAVFSYAVPAALG